MENMDESFAATTEPYGSKVESGAPTSVVRGPDKKTVPESMPVLGGDTGDPVEDPEAPKNIADRLPK